MSEVVVETPKVKGSCHVFVALDLAFAVDLERCAKLVQSPSRQGLKLTRGKAPGYVNFKSKPLVLVQEAAPIKLGGFETEPLVTVTIYEFGAVSVSYRFPIDNKLDELVRLSAELYEDKLLKSDARERADVLLSTIREALERPCLAPDVEDYVVFEILSGPEKGKLDEFVESHRRVLAGMLCSEKVDLSESQIDDALSAEVAYGADDRVIITWNASALFGEHMDDVKAVLELANVQLLEYVFLESMLKRDFEVEKLVRAGVFHLRSSMQQIAELAVDCQELNATVTNALMLVGHPYLAQVYSLASERFGLASWRRILAERVDVLHSNYRLVADRVAVIRNERLELVIILLIFFEIVMGLWEKLS